MSDVEQVRIHLRLDGSVEVNGISCPNVLSIQEPLAELAQQSNRPDLYIYSDDEGDYYGIDCFDYSFVTEGLASRVAKCEVQWETAASDRQPIVLNIH